MGQCCAPQVADEPMPVHHDVNTLVEEMHRYKTSNAKDVRSVKRYYDTKNKIEAYKDRMKRGHTRSLTPANVAMLSNADSAEPSGAVYGHESFDRRSANRFAEFKRGVDQEVRRRSRQPQIKGEGERVNQDEPESEDETPKRVQPKKAKKGRRGKSKEKESDHAATTPQQSMEPEEETNRQAEASEGKRKKKKKKRNAEDPKDSSQKKMSEEAKKKKKKKKDKK